LDNGTGDRHDRVLERHGDEKIANERRNALCKLFGASHQEIRIRKDFQDTETLLREIVLFNS
jgi:truncated hemoglobin YjbI